MTKLGQVSEVWANYPIYFDFVSILPVSEVLELELPGGFRRWRSVRVSLCNTG